MVFKNIFQATADQLQTKYDGYVRSGQNPADKGWLCEIFIRDFLNEFLGEVFNIYQGGNIINIDENISKQLDILLCSKNTLQIFRDKGVYPVETVFGVFSVTSTLNRAKLSQCIAEFQSIPKDNPKFEFDPPSTNIPENREHWNKQIPFKCVWAFKGDINQSWEAELNQMCKSNPAMKWLLPDAIVVNKVGMIAKNITGQTKTNTGDIAIQDFWFTDFTQYINYGACFTTILNELYKNNNWSKHISPQYFEYFNKDL